MKKLFILLVLVACARFGAVASDCGGVRCIDITQGGRGGTFYCCHEHLESGYCAQDYCWVAYACNPETDPCIDQQF